MGFNVGDRVKYNGKGYVDGRSHFEEDRNKEYIVVSTRPNDSDYDMVIEVKDYWGSEDSQYGTGRYWMVEETSFDLVEIIVLGGE